MTLRESLKLARLVAMRQRRRAREYASPERVRETFAAAVRKFNAGFGAGTDEAFGDEAAFPRERH